MDITYSFMIPVLEAIAKACHSYGWSIVFLTLLVRILVYPLVASSTRSMQKMSQMQPQLKAIQERYKNDPEMFQRKAVEFYQKNKINPMGGCLPTLVQLPVLFALFATFTGPPFGDKAIPVTVKVEKAGTEVKVHKNEVSGGNSPYVSAQGKLAKIVVFPGDATVVAGDSLEFGVRAVEGDVPADFAVTWRIQGDAHGATIDEKGHAVFPQAGEVHIEAMVPGVAKGESFGFINSLGKVASGMDLLKPENWDTLSLIILFGVTMYLSQKLMVQPPSPNADPEQMLIQQQTQRTMPFAVTAMFFFIPLPAGVYLYMVVSNVIQSLQTWWIMRNPAPALVDVLSDSGQAAADRPQKEEKTARAKDNVSGDDSAATGNGQSKPAGKKKSRKKK